MKIYYLMLVMGALCLFQLLTSGPMKSPPPLTADDIADRVSARLSDQIATKIVQKIQTQESAVKSAESSINARLKADSLTGLKEKMATTNKGWKEKIYDESAPTRMKDPPFPKIQDPIATPLERQAVKQSKEKPQSMLGFFFSKMSGQKNNVSP